MVTVKGVPATFGLVMVLMVKWSKVLKLKVLLEPTAVPAVAVRTAFAPEPLMLTLPVQLAAENVPVPPLFVWDRFDLQPEVQRRTLADSCERTLVVRAIDA